MFICFFFLRARCNKSDESSSARLQTPRVQRPTAPNEFHYTIIHYNRLFHQAVDHVYLPRTPTNLKLFHLANTAFIVEWLAFFINTAVPLDDITIALWPLLENLPVSLGIESLALINNTPTDVHTT